MTFNFKGIKANLEGINSYLEFNGITLSEQDKENITSIFEKVDKTTYKENEQGYNDGVLDFIEQMSFLAKISNRLPNIKEKVHLFFSGVEKEKLDKFSQEKTIENNDVTRVENQEKEIRPQILNKKITSTYSILAKDGIVVDTELLNKALNKLTKNKNSKMNNKASAFIKFCQKEMLSHKLDPFILIAICMQESARGNSKGALDKNNIAGLMGQHGLRKYKNVEECIDSLTRTMDKRMHEGRTTIISIGKSGRYCAKSASSTWIQQVTNYAEQLRSEYNKLLKEKYSQQTENGEK